MRYSLSVVLAIVLIGGSVASSRAQQTRVRPFIELTDADLERIDLHDGSVSDWIDVLGDAAAFTALEFIEGYIDHPYDPADLDFRIWLAWHDGTNRIYVAMERADDFYHNEFERSRTDAASRMLAHDSVISFFIDGDGGRDPRGLPPEGEDFNLWMDRVSQWYWVLGETFDEGPSMRLVNTDPDSRSEHGDWFLRPPYADGGGAHFGENPTISVTEFYITPYDLFVVNDPQATQITDLFPGKVINFKTTIVDVEGPRVDDGFFIYPAESSFRFPGQGQDWADGFLLDPGGVIPDNTAVEINTWGRIKASFNKEIP